MKLNRTIKVETDGGGASGPGPETYGPMLGEWPMVVSLGGVVVAVFANGTPNNAEEHLAFGPIKQFVRALAAEVNPKSTVELHDQCAGEEFGISFCDGDVRNSLAIGLEVEAGELLARMTNRDSHLFELDDEEGEE